MMLGYAEEARIGDHLDIRTHPKTGFLEKAEIVAASNEHHSIHNCSNRAWPMSSRNPFG